MAGGGANGAGGLVSRASSSSAAAAASAVAGVDAEVAAFFLNLAVCNTVVPQVLDNGHFVYQVWVRVRERLSERAVACPVGCVCLFGHVDWVIGRALYMRMRGIFCSAYTDRFVGWG
jgi:hypothetical protein